MPACDFCGTRILFGGVSQGNLRYCNSICARDGAVAQATLTVPEAELERQVRELHQGPCPKCGGPGPVDVHTSHRVYSALAFTRWSSHPEVSCQSCGRMRQLKHAVFSFFLGWWGFPHGLIITPVQVTRNLAGLIGMGAPDPGVPSPALHKAVRLSMAARRQAS